MPVSHSGSHAASAAAHCKPCQCLLAHWLHSRCCWTPGCLNPPRNWPCHHHPLANPCPFLFDLQVSRRAYRYPPGCICVQASQMPEEGDCCRVCVRGAYGCRWKTSGSSQGRVSLFSRLDSNRFDPDDPLIPHFFSFPGCSQGLTKRSVDFGSLRRCQWSVLQCVWYFQSETQV